MTPHGNVTWGGMRDPVDSTRAEIYRLLAGLIWAAPDKAGLVRLGAMVDEGSAIGRVLGAVAQAARQASADTVGLEHFNLFTGVGGGDLFPYASYYLTGFMHERPLADLRAELQELGFVRVDGLAEPEDHAAFLCEMMATLIQDGGDDQGFFARHLAPWIGRFFGDLERTETARFYRAVGALGAVFIDIEQAAFALPV